MFIRPIAHTDLDALYDIALESGPGFTSLMPDRDALARKIDHSIASFARDIRAPGDEHYLFVLEDEATGDIMGTTAIEAAAGRARPLYHFRHNTLVHHSRDLGLRRQEETLTRCRHYTGCTEICSLYLRPKYRRANAGKLLSKVRFLFMAMHPERFADTVIAEMRGVSDAQGQSPLWTWLKHHFVDMDFAEATHLVGSGYTDFIEELMPAHPLYSQLMSPEARAVIGQVHEQTRPALRMLEAEGFRKKGYVDLFDGGPTVECPLGQIASIGQSVGCRVRIRRGADAIGRPSATTGPLLIANHGLSDFRATVTDEAWHEPRSQALRVPAATALLLGLTDGAGAHILPLQARATQVPAEHTPRVQEAHYAH